MLGNIDANTGDAQTGWGEEEERRGRERRGGVWRRVLLLRVFFFCE
jgi:xylose isomerase